MHQPAKNGDEVTDYGNITVTAKELASVLGLSEAQIYTLRRRGILQSLRAKRTEFLLGPSVRAYIQYKCGQESESQADFHKERALKEKANRQLREILVQQTRSQLHDAADVESIQTHSNNQIRSRLLAFSDLLASALPGVDPNETKAIIDAQVRKVLLQLTRYDPKDYYRWLARHQKSSPRGSPS
jgi:phage terminase Nu1 subunit (DNA packaging protein)